MISYLIMVSYLYYFLCILLVLVVFSQCFFVPLFLRLTMKYFEFLWFFHHLTLSISFLHVYPWLIHGTIANCLRLSLFLLSFSRTFYGLLPVVIIPSIVAFVIFEKHILQLCRKIHGGFEISLTRMVEILIQNKNIVYLIIVLFSKLVDGRIFRHWVYWVYIENNGHGKVRIPSLGGI